jgi:DNA-binding beta-propeller fold protein YncE
VAIAGKRGLAYAANGNSNDISVITLGPDDPVFTLPLGTQPIDLAGAVGNTNLHVLTSTQALTINTETRMITRRRDFDGNPFKLALSPDARELYVSDPVRGLILVLDASTLRNVRRIQRVGQGVGRRPRPGKSTFRGCQRRVCRFCRL